MHAIYNPVSTYTPSEREAANARRERQRRIAAAAVKTELGGGPKSSIPKSPVLPPIPNKLMREALSLLPSDGRFGLSMEVICRAVLRHFPGVSMADLLSPRRDRPTVRPRQIVMYLARTMTQRSLPDIGRRLGRRDHTTAMAGIQKIESLRKTDPKINADVCAIIAALGGTVE